MKACEDKDVNLAMSIIKSKNLKLDSVDSDGRTALMYAIKNQLKDVAIELINSGHSNPGAVDKILNNTALILSVKGNLPNIVTALINSGQSNIEQADHFGYTALIWSFKKRLYDIGFEIIETNKSNPGQVDNVGETALIHAVSNLMDKKTIKQKIQTLRETYDKLKAEYKTILQSINPIDRENIGKNKRWPLNLLNKKKDAEYTKQKFEELYNFMKTYDYKKISDSIIEFINTGKSKPEQVDKTGKTALIYSIENGLEDISKELILSGNSNVEHVDEEGKTALMYAEEKNAAELVKLLKSLTKKLEFNINNDCFDFMNIETIPIVSFLKEDNNIVFVFFDDNINVSFRVGISVELFKDKIKNKHEYIVYECNIPDTMRPENIVRDVPYFDIKKLCGFGDVIPLESITSILDTIDTGLSNNIFIFKRDNELISTVSDDVLNQRTNYISARHCQTGQNAFVYKLLKNVIFTCNNKNRKPKTKKNIVIEEISSENKETSIKNTTANNISTGGKSRKIYKRKNQRKSRRIYVNA